MEKLKEILSTLGYAVAYDHFNTNTKTPFLIFRRHSTRNFMADGRVNKKVNNIYVELYTDKKDIEIEQKLENLFDKNDIVYNIESELYIQEENVYQIIYEINEEV